MNQKQISTVKKHLTIKGGQVMTASLDVANFFNKKHKDVLKAIKNLECSPEFRGRNFAPTFYEVPGPNNSSRKEPMVEMTRDGFTMLAFGFTGKEAVRFREAYIAAFNQMEAALAQRPAETQKIFVPLGDFPAAERPVAVVTACGMAYINTATYLLISLARARPGGEESRLLLSALGARVELREHLPEPFRTAERLRAALLKEKPLWSDILHCQRMGLTAAAIGRVCGCHPSTVRKNQRKMEEAGLFNDPLAGLFSAPPAQLEVMEARS